MTQLATGELESYLEPVWAGNQELTSIEYTYPNGEKKEIALGILCGLIAYCHQPKKPSLRLE